MQLGRRNWKTGSLSKTLGQGDMLSPVPKEGRGGSKSSEEPQPLWMDRVDLGWLPDVHQAALSLPLLNSSPSAGAALCKSQNKYKAAWEDTWLAKVELKKPQAPFQKPPCQSTSFGQGEGDGAELSFPHVEQALSEAVSGHTGAIMPRGCGDGGRASAAPQHGAPTTAGLCQTHARWAAR